MSFSGEMKEEIARLIPMQEADVRAELSALFVSVEELYGWRTVWRFWWKRKMWHWQRRL